jgi:YD repeat-containing protein
MNSRRRVNSTVRHPSQIMKTLVTIALLLLAETPALAQQAIANKAPKVFGPVESLHYKYDSYTFNRNKTRVEELVSNGRKVIWSFTPQGQPLTSEIFERDGHPSGTKSVYNYDSAGRLTSIVHRLLGSHSFTEIFAYPETRRVKITSVFESYNHTGVEIDDYDSKGNIIKRTFYTDGNLDYTELNKYDDKGNPTEVVRFDGAGKQWIKETYTYEFDSHGNWTTERVEALADPLFGIPPKTTITRRITYY